MSITRIPLIGVKLLVVDDADVFYSSRNCPGIYRLGEACPKAQILIFANYWIDNFEILSENRMKGPVFIELDEKI